MQDIEIEPAETPREEHECIHNEQEAVVRAERYIEEQRKQDIVIEGLEPNKPYRVELERPEFPFGTAVRFFLVLDKYEDAPQYRQAMLEEYPDKKEEIEAFFAQYTKEYRDRYVETLGMYFDGITTEEILSWRGMTSGGVLNWKDADRAMDFLRQQPEILQNARGHFIFWNRKVQLPRNIRELPKEQLREIVLNERLEIIRRYPEITQWNLLNEPLKRSPQLTESGVDENEVVFDPVEDLDFFVELFKRAKEANPSAKFYLNEFTILNGHKLGEYVDFIKRLQDGGAPVDAVGVQGHIFAWKPATIVQAAKSLDTLTELGLPIKITEFDVSDAVFNGDSQRRAEYTQNITTVCYGHPAVEEFYLWGFQDLSGWRGGEKAGFFDENFNPNDTGQAYFGKVKGEWRTSTEVISDETGTIRFRGFPGKYHTLPVLDSDEKAE